MVAVSSLDGKITRGSSADIYQWTSGEDAALFSSLVKKHNLIIMGRKTYEAARKKIRFSPGKLRVVLTKSPGNFKDKEGLEFTGKHPIKLLRDMEARGYERALVAGGGAVNALFLKNNLVDEVWLTVEPCMFGKGKSLVEGAVKTQLVLIGTKKLNKRGTLHLKYKVKSKA